MATIEAGSARSGHGRGFAGNVRKVNLKVDMTPMVDLAFLLITFFVFTASMSAPNTVDLNMPVDDGPQQPVAESGAFHILLGKEGRISFYEGRLAPDGSNIKTVSPLELRVALIRKKAEIIEAYQPDANCEARAVATRTPVEDCKQQKMMVLIKPTPEADYTTIVNVLDEMTINKIARYALVKPDHADLTFFRL